MLNLVVYTRQQAQTLEQRRRNAKFAKEQDARRGKSETDIKKRTKDIPKSPISPVWLEARGTKTQAIQSTIGPVANKGVTHFQYFSASSYLVACSSKSSRASSSDWVADPRYDGDLSRKGLRQE
ncbi:hypothetical protein GGS21DRAFT_486195 [Xylaria nigripes]|nr:hypothetical protein GGS21DRAFT_486195 [Xylaria nigripes]